jgi:hypothetical protein
VQVLYSLRTLHVAWGVSVTAQLHRAGDSAAAAPEGQRMQELSELEALSKEVLPRTLQRHARSEETAARLAGAAAILAAAGAS